MLVIYSQSSIRSAFMLGILPHGIIEIPAFIIGQAAALSLGSMAIAAVFIQEKDLSCFKIFEKI